MNRKKKKNLIDFDLIDFRNIFQIGLYFQKRVSLFEIPQYIHTCNLREILSIFGCEMYCLFTYGHMVIV